VTPAEQKSLAEATAEATVARTFLALGVDMSTPAGVLSTQRDFAFLRTARYTVRRAGTLLITGIIITTLAWFGIKTEWHP
jgi:hypothetical protein